MRETVPFGPFYNPKVALRLAVNVSAIAAGTLSVTILGFGQSSGATWTILASTAIAARGCRLAGAGRGFNRLSHALPPLSMRDLCQISSATRAPSGISPRRSVHRPDVTRGASVPSAMSCPLLASRWMHGSAIRPLRQFI